VQVLNCVDVKPRKEKMSSDAKDRKPLYGRTQDAVAAPGDPLEDLWQLAAHTDQVITPVAARAENNLVT
jgi:hypothetical protein